jgi:NADPH:quinone reductase-like Zn-dependent oxidoreductase
MKAAYITRYGGTEVIKVGDLPDPETGDNQILVEVKVVSINPVDYKTISGIARIISGFKFPKTIGSDFAGVVRKAGSAVKDFKEGDRIYGSSPVIFRKPGMMAELAAIETVYARHLPDSITFEDAASLPIAALTALNGLRKCGVSEGKIVLINGATGGVGHFALQIAKAKGAFVTASCSEKNGAFAKSLGADEVLDYSKNDMSKSVRKFDAILDAYGKMNYGDIIRLLKKKGTYASTLFFPPLSFLALHTRILFNIKMTSANMRRLPEDYSEMEKLLLDKKIKPVIDKIFTLEKTAEAFDYAEKRKPKGKVLVKI